MRWLTLLALLPVTLLAGCGKTLGPEEARALLQRVQAARRQTAVQARLTTSVRVKDTILRSDALLSRTPGIVQMQYLTGRFAGWRVYEQDGMVWRVDPAGKAHPSQGGAEPGGLAMRFTPGLTVRYDGPGLAAWRRAQRYTIAPGNAGQARLRVAVDAQTGYPLRYRRYDLEGQLLSATTYRRINYRAPLPQRVAVPPEASREHARRGRDVRARPATKAELQALLGGPLLQPAYIPAGFQARGSFIHQGPRRKFAELRYSDGLRALAVIQFQRPASADKLPTRAVVQTRKPRQALWRNLMRAGAPNQPPSKAQPGGPWQRMAGGPSQGAQKGTDDQHRGLGRSILRGDVVRERRGDRVVLVVGELPQAELQKVMDSIPGAAAKSRPGVHF